LVKKIYPPLRRSVTVRCIEVSTRRPRQGRLWNREIRNSL